MHVVAGITITTEQWQLLRTIYNPFKDGMHFTNVQKFYDGDPRRMMHELRELVAKGLVHYKQEMFYTTPAVDVTFQPSDVPLTPGERRPYVSNSSSEAQDIPDVTRDALTKLAKTPVRADKEMLKILNKSRTTLDLDEGQEAGLDMITAWGSDKDIYSDAFTDWRGRVYHQSSVWGSFQQSRLMRSLLATNANYAVDTDSPEYAYFLTIIEHEFDVTEENADALYFAAKKNGVASTKHANQVRAAQAVSQIKRYGETNYIMEQDASCSGGQIVALLQGDRDLAAATNLIPGMDRQDLYMIVATAAERCFNDLSIEKAEWRTAAKPVVMLSFYGASAQGIQANVWLEQGGTEENMGEDGVTINWLGVDMDSAQVMELVSKLQRALFDLFPKFTNFLAMAKTWWDSEEEHEFEWELDPEACTAYKNMEWTTQTGYMIKRSITVDKMKGMMPNFVHSCDGSVVQIALNKADFFMLTVHDAFCSKITDSLKMKALVIEAYQEMARASYCPDSSETHSFSLDNELIDGLTDAMVIGEVATTTITH